MGWRLYTVLGPDSWRVPSAPHAKHILSPEWGRRYTVPGQETLTVVCFQRSRAWARQLYAFTTPYQAHPRPWLWGEVIYSPRARIVDSCKLSAHHTKRILRRAWLGGSGAPGQASLTAACFPHLTALCRLTSSTAACFFHQAPSTSWALAGGR